MPVEILAEMSWSFAGKPPDVHLSSDIEVEEWRHTDGSNDPADKPMFVTLPLLKVGTTSRNGLNWDRPSALRVVHEINSKRPGGNLGHMPPEKRSTDYKLPVLRWLGAMLDEKTGLVWAKAYVPKYAQDVREFLADAKRARARVGTSVYGMRGEKGLVDLNLEDVDLGHADRVSHPNAAAVPHITAEMLDESNDKRDNKGENPNMSEVQGDSLKLVSELTTARDTALRQISDLTSKVGERDNTISEMQKRDTVLKGVEGLVSEFAGADVTAKVTALVAELRDLRQKQAKAQVDGWIAEAIKAVELEALRPTIIAQMGEVDSADKAKARVTELMAREDIKEIAEALVLKTAGGRAIVGAGNGNGFKFDESPEAVAASQRRVGI